jgi:hypothetical protein
MFPTFEYISENRILTYGQTKGENEFLKLKQLLESCDDYVVFLIAKRQEETFQHMIRKYDLNQFITFDQGKFIHNPNYMDSGPRIKMYILKGKGEYCEP